MIKSQSDSRPDIVPLDELAFANGRPALMARIKQECADFKVDENLGFELTGSGEHVYVRIKKTDLSTTEVARRLQDVAAVERTDIGYSGMKDRRAETTQWFSVRLEPNSESRLNELEDNQLEILETRRNSRKLKIGSHKANHFRLLLRQCQGEPSQYEERLENLIRLGVPNYFGSQRFGREMGNIHQVLDLMERALAEESDHKRRGRAGSVKRGMLLSAARAYLFNQVLSLRLHKENWNRYLDGDVLNLDGTSRFFAVKSGEWDNTLQRRLDEFDIHLTGPLVGIIDEKDKYVSRLEAADIEDAVCQQFTTLVSGLQHFGLQASRRALRFRPVDLSWRWLQGSELELDFVLPRGTYATSLLREVCVNKNEHK